MNIINGSLVAISTISFFLALIVYFKSPKSSINLSFTLFILSSVIWPISIVFFRIAPDVNSALLWDKIIYIAGTLVPVSFLLFSYVFTEKKLPPLIDEIVYILIPSLFIFLLLFTNLWIAEIRVEHLEKTVILGIVYPVWMIYFGVFMGFGAFKIWRKYQVSSGLTKAQLGYFLLAILFPLTGAFPFNIILPLLGNYDLIFIGPFFISAMIILIFYAIIKHRLFDVKYALLQLINYSVVSSLTSAFLLITLFCYSLFSKAPVTFELETTIVIASFILVLIFKFFQNASQSISKTFFFQSVYDYQEAFNNLSRNLASILEMPKLVDLIIETLKNTMKINRVAVLVRDYEDYHFKIQKTVGFNEDNGIALVKDNFLTSYLEEHPKIIVLEEVKKISQEVIGDISKKAFQEIASHMEYIEAELIVPVINAGKMISLIVLGNKVTGDSYTVQDINLLSTISIQASIAIENARLYKEIQVFNTRLEEKVQQATEEIQARNIRLEEANIQIGLAQKLKNDLLTMASHEFRTPLSIIKNALWFLNTQEVKAKLSEKERQNLERIEQTMERLSYVVSNINQMLLTTSGELTLEVSPVQTEIIIKEVIEDKQMEAKDKQILLEYKESENMLPEIIADKVKLKYVFWELITNALKYTGTGGKISVETGIGNNRLEIKVSDTGRGIQKEVLQTLFQGFKKTDIMHTTQAGMGLGLYIIKKIIDLHEGAVKVDSQEGKGTTFTIFLPTKELSEIKSENSMLDNNIPKTMNQSSLRSNGEEKLEYPLQMLKCIMAFQIVVGSIIYHKFT